MSIYVGIELLDQSFIEEEDFHLQICIIPPDISYLTDEYFTPELEELYAYDNPKLTGISEQIIFSSLRVLDLSNTQITTLPALPKTLETIRLEGVRLKGLPPNLIELSPNIQEKLLSVYEGPEVGYLPSPPPSSSSHFPE